MRNTKILITGGNGFIGSKLVEKLVNLKNRPTLILRKNSDKKRLNFLLDKVKIHEADITNYKEIKGIIEATKPQMIFHLASFGVYSYTSNDYINTSSIINTNIKGTVNLLYLAHQAGCEIFINTGSCFEYGSSKNPFIEESVLAPTNIYGASKVATTLFSKIFSKNTTMAIVTLRPFTVYGPDEDERRFISTAIKQCLAGESLKLTSQKIIRDYIFVDDVIDAYLLTAKLGKKLNGEILNISTGKGMDLESVARIIIKLTRAKNIKAEIGAFPIRKGEVMTLVGAPEKAKKLLNWYPKYSLEDGIEKTIDWIKNSS